MTLRKLELSQGAPFGSPIGRHILKDIRRDVRVNVAPIYSETQFNDFLLDSPTSRAAFGYKSWLRSILRVDHRIVFSHADFHPRNIMVVDRPDGMIDLSGIIDWEASGFYPEYWEQLKAMNTRSIKDSSDWWEYLPKSILGYDHEVVLDQVIESTVVY
jgi:thiamine kinase-like enzyme